METMIPSDTRNLRPNRNPASERARKARYKYRLKYMVDSSDPRCVRVYCPEIGQNGLTVWPQQRPIKSMFTLEECIADGDLAGRPLPSYPSHHSLVSLLLDINQEGM